MVVLIIIQVGNECVIILIVQVSVAEAAKMLLIESPPALVEYAAKRSWVYDPTNQFFVFTRDEKNEDLHFVRNTQLISQALGYARELEKIV